MKKLIAATVLFLSSFALYALPCGNPSEPTLMLEGLIWDSNWDNYWERADIDSCWCWCDAISYRVGFYGDYVFNRHLTTHGESDFEFGKSRIFTNAAYLAVDFCDRFDVFATLGATHFTFENSALFTGRVSTHNHFSWSVGGRLILLECGCTTLGVEAQYFQTCPTLRRVSIPTVALEPQNLHLRYREGQAGIGISHRIWKFVPYVAAKWSKARGRLQRTPFFNHREIQNSKSFGYAVGLSYVEWEAVSLTAEGRFGDEKALYVNAQVRF